MNDGLVEWVITLVCLLVAVFWFSANNEPAGTGYILAAVGWGAAAFKEFSNGKA